MDEKDEDEFQKIEKSILRTTKIVKWVLILFIGLTMVLIFFGGLRINYIFFKEEKTIVVSKSPNLINELDIKVIGSNFGPGNAPIKIYYGKIENPQSTYMIKHIGNNGASLDEKILKLNG